MFGVVIGFLEEAVDGGLEIDNALEDAPPEALPGQLGKEPFEGVEPGGRGRSEVEVEPRMPFKPGSHLGVLVRGVVVNDQVQLPPGRGFAIDLVEEADELSGGTREGRVASCSKPSTPSAMKRACHRQI